MVTARLAEKLGKKLRTLRGDMTQRDFARRIGISQPVLNRIEQGTQNVTLETIQRMCDRLNCGIGYLFGEDE